LRTPKVPSVCDFSRACYWVAFERLPTTGGNPYQGLTPDEALRFQAIEFQHRRGFVGRRVGIGEGDPRSCDKRPYLRSVPPQELLHILNPTRAQVRTPRGDQQRDPVLEVAQLNVVTRAATDGRSRDAELESSIE
jgi:hypothetical protein